MKRSSAVGYETIRKIKAIKGRLSALERKITEAELRLIAIPDKNKSVKDKKDELKYTSEL